MTDKVRVWSIQRVLFGLLLHEFTRPRLQAAAAARIQGQPDIHSAAASGNAALVKDHFVADATSIHLCTPCCYGVGYADPFVSFSKFLDESRNGIILPVSCPCTHSGLTPLHFSSENGHLEVCQLLLSLGAEVDAMDNEYALPPCPFVLFSKFLDESRNFVCALQPNDSASLLL
jgi:hypothetical protein